jgi:hypothetical protein
MGFSDIHSMIDFAHILLGKDLRTNSRNWEVIEAVQDQNTFDELFALLWHHERTLVMRAADAVEKVTMKHKEFLDPHKHQLLSLLKSAVNNELKWHVAQLVPRLKLREDEMQMVWSVLAYWAQSPNESKIVRVNSLQGLFDLAQQFPLLKKTFHNVLEKLKHEPIASLQARIKKLKSRLQ